MKENIIKFIIKIVCLSLIIPFLIILLRLCNYYPMISNDKSFDAKYYELKKHHYKNIDVISIGSSMTLNNLNSIVINNYIKSSYYNLGSWGIQISNISNLIEYYINQYHPRVIMVCSSITDFCEKDQLKLPTKYELTIGNYINEYFYLKNFDMLGIIKRNISINHLKENNNIYQSLKYDECGGVELEIPQKNISKYRWDEKMIFPTKYTNYQYSELTKLSKLLQNNNIKFIFIQAPIKYSLITDLGNNKVIYNHFVKCKNIIEKYGGTYLNYHNPNIFKDSLFVDQYHLSKNGSIIFTKMLVSPIKNVFNGSI